MGNYLVHYTKNLTGFIKLKNVSMNITLKESVIGIFLSAVTSAITVISFQYFKKNRNRILRLKKLKSNKFKLQRQMVVLWNNFSKYLKNPFTFYNNHIGGNYYDYGLFWYNYEKNRKLYEMKNFNTFVILKFNMQLQGKSHLLIKNSGMIIGAFHKMANFVLLR